MHDDDDAEPELFDLLPLHYAPPRGPRRHWREADEVFWQISLFDEEEEG